MSFANQFSSQIGIFKLRNLKNKDSVLPCSLVSTPIIIRVRYGCPLCSTFAGIILGMGSANGRRRYYVTPSLIGRTHTQNDPSFVIAALNEILCYIEQCDNDISMYLDNRCPNSVQLAASKPIKKKKQKNKNNVVFKHCLWYVAMV